MNTGQMLLTMLAMILLATLILRVNNNFATNSSAIYNSKFVILGTSIASTMLEEISDYAFDEFSVAAAVDTTTALTVPSKLGPDSGEVYPFFNDIDDFNGFTKTDSTIHSTLFKVFCSVNYVYPTTPDIISSTRTWTKKISVIVTSPSMTDTVRLSTLYSYWAFR